VDRASGPDRAHPDSAPAKDTDQKKLSDK
jgi:hypothetical protein